MSVKAKFQAATRKEDGVQFLHAAAAATIYVTLPTLLKQSGWMGMLTGFLGAWGYGVLVGSKGAQYGTFGVAAAHLWYTQGQSVVQSVTGTTIWRFDTATSSQFSDQLMSYPDAQMTAPALNDITATLPGGAAAPLYGGSLSDYTTSPNFNAAMATMGRGRMNGNSALLPARGM